MAEFKSRAEAAASPSDMWEIESFLRQRRREIDETFDFRYSQLPLVFARLMQSGLLEERELAGLSEEKLEIIRSLLSLAAER